MFHVRKWAANAPVISTFMFAFLCVSATLSLAERIAAKDIALKAEVPALNGTAAYRLAGSRWVEIGSSEYGHYITRVKINGAEVAALIDTGSTAVALSYEDAERAGLNPFRLKFDRRISTANGIAMAAPVRLDLVVVGGIAVKSVDGIVLRKGAMRGTLLGMSFLNRLTGFRVERGTLYLED